MIQVTITRLESGLIHAFTLSGHAQFANRGQDLVCAGVSVLLFFQVFVNIGMNMGIVPVVGITLPLFSYGGSSMISFLLCLGLVQSLERYNLDY